MWFHVLLVIIALGLVVQFVRSTQFKQWRRGHGTGRAPFNSATDHALLRSGQLPRTDPAPREPGPHERD